MKKKESQDLLELIYKDNPLALPLKILNELKSEATKALETFARAPMMLAKKPFELVNMLKGGKKKVEDDGLYDIVKRYIMHTPKRNV